MGAVSEGVSAEQLARCLERAAGSFAPGELAYL